MGVKNDSKLCDICGGCVGVCPVIALEIIGEKMRVDNKKCINCLACVRLCPVAAMSLEEGK